jgi:hypothetical protein
MRKQSVLIGEIAIEGSPPMLVHADLSGSHMPRALSAILKDKLVFLLGERFRPSKPERKKP